MSNYILASGGSNVIRISLPYIFTLASNLEPLGALPQRQTPYSELHWRLVAASNAITELTTGALYASHLRASYNLAQALLNCLAAHTGNPNQDRSLSSFDVYQIRNTYDQYKTALIAELGVVHSYFVVQKGGYDTWSLLMNGEHLFPSDLIAKVPEATFDAREAGKCLAYESATAAGFHMFRLLELVLRRYYVAETQSGAVPKVRNIAVYVNAMRQSGRGDERTLVLLREISDRYRNPLVHPDTVLTLDDAITIHGMVRAAVAQMLARLTVPLLTTALPVQAISGLLNQ